MKKYIWQTIFLLVLLIVSYFYSYHKIIYERPQSVHKWRQSDCASLALNYYQNGMHFFQPETHNLTSEGGVSGKACTSEVPILYYSVAAFYKVFGYNEAIYRILNTLLFFIGLFYLFRLLKYLLDDNFWSISISILFFTSPVLVYYGNNFLSNSTALAFSIVGWFYFIRFYSERIEKWFFTSVLFFLLAATFKVTALFSLFAVGAIYLLEVSNFTRFNKTGKLFNKPIKHLFVMAGAVAIVFVWIIYAMFYNQKHDCTYFSTTVFPVWMLDKSEIVNVLSSIKNNWLSHYYHFSVLVFLLFCSAFLVICHKKNLKLLNLVLVIIGIELLVYVLLQFWTFKDHDYYTIDMYIFPVLILLSTFFVLKRSFEKVFSSIFTKLIFAGFVVFNIYYAQKINTERYEGWRNNFGELNDSYTITSYLREIGISANDTVISIPDGSHVSLYLMNQKGWTEYQDARLNRGEPIKYNSYEAGIQKSINRGAKYLIVNGIGQLYEKPYLQNFCTQLKGHYNNTFIFDLRQTEMNFNLRNREVLERLFCDAEVLTEDKKGFYGQPDSIIFRNGEIQSANFARSGNNSCKVEKESPFGCTIKLKNLQFGESFLLTVWRLKSTKGRLIASAEDFYYKDYEIVERNEGWEKLQMELFVSKELDKKEMGFYLYNPDVEPVYFDDFEIIRYKSILD